MRFAKTRVAVGFASTNDVNGNGRWKSARRRSSDRIDGARARGTDTDKEK